MIYVNWYGAKEYTKWLMRKTGFPFRLPSEAEWEFAARGGKSNSRFRYSGSNKIKEVGWYIKNSHNTNKFIGNVGSRPESIFDLKISNELGIFDMSGNVQEWCADNWHDGYYKAPEDGSAWVKKVDSNDRVVRGGSWFFSEINGRVSDRFKYYTLDRKANVGFRLVLSSY